MKRKQFTDSLGWPQQTPRESVTQDEWADPISKHTADHGHAVVQWLSGVGVVVLIGLLFSGAL